MIKNIFTQKEISCPACQTQFLIKYPNPKLYAAVSRDEDQRVSAYSWTMGVQTDVQPHYYSVLQCPECLLSDFYERLEKPGTDRKSREVYQNVQKMPPSRRLLLRRLRRTGKDNADPDLAAAIVLHLSAIFCVLSPGEEKHIDHLRLGRLSLRLSWLFREWVSSSPSAAGLVGSESSRPSASNALPRIGDAAEELEETLNAAHDQLDTLKKEIRRRGDELGLSPDNNPYQVIASSLENLLGDALQTLGKLEEIAVKDKKNILILREKTPSRPFSSLTGDKSNDEASSAAANPSEILSAVKQQWPQMPDDEPSAMALAVEALDYSFKNEAGEQNMQQNLGLGTLLLHLLTKSGRLEKALDLSSLLYRVCFRDKQSLQAQLSAPKKEDGPTDEEFKEMNKTLNTVINTLNKAAESRKNLLEQLYARDKEKISAILRPLAGSPLKNQLQALIGAGFHSSLAEFLMEKFSADAARKKKN